MKAVLQFPSLETLALFQKAAALYSYRILATECRLAATFSAAQIHQALHTYQASIISSQPVAQQPTITP